MDGDPSPTTKSRRADNRFIPPDARRSLRVYNLFFPLVFLILLPGFLLRMLRRGGFREKLGQRLAIYSASDLERFRSRKWIWIHSISVGETFIALKLAQALHARLPDLGVLLSATTSTGFAEARKSASDWLEPIYNPIDAPWIVRRALDALQPHQLVLIEGEAWPNLVAECRRRGISVSLANARLSPRSERRFRKFRAWTGPIFRLLDHVCVPDPEDLARWEGLGVPTERLTRTGSIKFDNPAVTASREEEFRAMIAPLGITRATPVIVAGSTWAPEEAVLASILPALRRDSPNCFLIIVPRHIERTPEILRELTPLNLRIARRSELPQSQPADILIVDSTGELRDWYALATVVFVGKSLPGVASVGGQNPAEPAVLGKPVIFGPHMENFGVLVSHLSASRAAIQVASIDDLEKSLRSLLADAELRETLGEAARKALASHAGATHRTAELLARHER